MKKDRKIQTVLYALILFVMLIISLVLFVIGVVEVFYKDLL